MRLFPLSLGRGGGVITLSEEVSPGQKLTRRHIMHYRSKATALETEGVSRHLHFPSPPREMKNSLARVALRGSADAHNEPQFERCISR